MHVLNFLGQPASECQLRHVRNEGRRLGASTGGHDLAASTCVSHRRVRAPRSPGRRPTPRLARRPAVGAAAKAVSGNGVDGRADGKCDLRDRVRRAPAAEDDASVTVSVNAAARPAKAVAAAAPWIRCCSSALLGDGWLRRRCSRRRKRAYWLIVDRGLICPRPRGCTILRPIRSANRGPQ